MALTTGATLPSTRCGFAELRDAVSGNTPEWAAALTEIPAALIEETARAMADAKPGRLCSPRATCRLVRRRRAARSRRRHPERFASAATGGAGGISIPGCCESCEVPGSGLSDAKPTVGRWRRFHVSVRKQEAHVESDPRNGGAEALSDQGMGGLGMQSHAVHSEHGSHPEGDRRISTSSWSSTFSRAKWPDGRIWCYRSAHISSDTTTCTPRTSAIPIVALRQPVVPPLYESRPNYDIFRGLASRMGLAATTHGQIGKSIWTRASSPSGTRLREMKDVGFKRIGETPKPVETGTRIHDAVQEDRAVLRQTRRKGIRPRSPAIPSTADLQTALSGCYKGGRRCTLSAEP